MASNEPLMGWGLLPDWLRKKRIYALDKFDDNLAPGEKNWVQERNCDAAKNLGHEYYGDKNLKKRDVRPTKLVDFEGIARHHNVNIMLHERKKDGKGCKICMVVSLWQDSAQKRPAHNKHGTIEGPLFLHQEDGCAL